jgi:hypothetical protein
MLAYFFYSLEITLDPDCTDNSKCWNASHRGNAQVFASKNKSLS